MLVMQLSPKMNFKNFLQNAAVLTSSKCLHTAAFQTKTHPRRQASSLLLHTPNSSVHNTLPSSLPAYPIQEGGAGSHW